MTFQRSIDKRLNSIKGGTITASTERIFTAIFVVLLFIQEIPMKTTFRELSIKGELRSQSSLNVNFVLLLCHVRTLLILTFRARTISKELMRGRREEA
jgi:hypothetical protein